MEKNTLKKRKQIQSKEFDIKESRHHNVLVSINHHQELKKM